MRSEALSRAISVFKILEFFREVSFLLDRSLLAKTSAREIPLGQSLWPELHVQEHDLPFGAPVLCQENRHTKKLAHKVFRALASWRNRAPPRNPGCQNFVCPSVPLVFSTQIATQRIGTQSFCFGPLVVKKLAVKNFVCLSWLRKRQEKTPEFEIILPGTCCSSTHLSVDASHPSIPPSDALILHQKRSYHKLA